MLILKAMIYVTSPQGLLVFEEPASPHIGLQIPGGTIEPGEEPLIAAGRELYEETGLVTDKELHFLGSLDATLKKSGRSVMRRYYYHIDFEGQYPESWEHYEMHPSDGGEPILFRLFWLPFQDVRQHLHHNMAELFHHVPHRGL